MLLDFLHDACIESSVAEPVENNPQLEIGDNNVTFGGVPIQALRFALLAKLARDSYLDDRQHILDRILDELPATLAEYMPPPVVPLAQAFAQFMAAAPPPLVVLPAAAVREGPSTAAAPRHVIQLEGDYMPPKAMEAVRRLF